MAVSVQAPYHSLPSMWHIGQPPTTFQTTYDAASESASYYNAATLEPSSVIPIYQQPRIIDQATNTDQSAVSIKSHDPSSLSKGVKIKRSISTPNVRGSAASADNPAMVLSADKRRNKLGYHRTSVACGHCRRRKIRCIPAPGDHHNRCSNCIRLKKECNFFPVDQQAPPEPRRKQSKPLSLSLDGFSGSTSPSATQNHTLSTQPVVSTIPLRNPPLIQDLGGAQMKRQRTGSLSPDHRDAATSRTYEYSMQSWIPTELSPHPGEQFDNPDTLWRGTNESPVTPAFSQFSPASSAIHQPMWPIPHTGSIPRNDITWVAPPRSSSYGSYDKVQDSHHTPFTPNHPTIDPFPSKASTLRDLHPASNMSTAPRFAGSRQDLSVEAPPSGSMPGYSSWQPPYSFSGPPPPSSASYSAWNVSSTASMPLQADVTHIAQQQFLSNSTKEG